jgi:7,8-dihydropterin-6-yl-methyl-4-(beta-D-ribofuranosyl)aminobenzene 5'-phosphate synthase
MRKMKMTILYDNSVYTRGTRSKWGFSCLIEGLDKTILFDTGARPEILQHNAAALEVDWRNVDQIVLSHAHWDHTGGLWHVLERNPNVTVFVPQSFEGDFCDTIKKTGAEVVLVSRPQQICEHAHLTGEMEGKVAEQSLYINASPGVIIITGCSHPGIVEILQRVKELTDRNIYLALGGFHLAKHTRKQVVDIIDTMQQMGVQKCGPTHCTGAKVIRKFGKAFGDNLVKMGTGRIISVT